MPTANPVNIKVTRQIPRGDIAFAVARKPGTSQLFCGGSDFTVYEIDVDLPKPQAKEFGRHASYVTGLALAGENLVSGGYDGRLIWWNAESGAMVRQIEAHRKWVRAVTVAPSGSVLASVADDMVCRVWEAQTGRLIHELRGHDEMTPTHFSSMLFACAISSDSRHLATGDKVGHITVWDLESGKKLASLEAPAMYTWDPVQRRHSIGGIRSLAFSRDGVRLAAGGIGKVSNIDHFDGKARVEIFNWREGKRTHEFVSDKYNGLVEYLSFHPKGDWLLAAGGGDKDGFISLLDLSSQKVVAHDKVPMYVHDLAINEAGDTIYAVGHKNIAVLRLERS